MSLDNYNFWNDPRTRAGMRSAPFRVRASREGARVVFAESLASHLQDSGLLDGDEIVVPVRYAVCSLCEGTATVVDPNIDAGGLSRDDFDADPDFEEDYSAGRYDIPCPTCGGLRVEAVPTFSPEIQAAVNEWIADDAEYVALCASERAMGA